MNQFISNFENYDDKVAIVFNQRKYSYRELLSEINYISENIIHKIKPSEVVSIISDYSFEAIALFFALYKNKNIIAPIATKIESEQEEKISESYSDKSITIIDGRYVVEPRQAADKHHIIKCLQRDLCSGLILFSSGSTGKPKAMIHNFDDLVDHYKLKKPKTVNIILFLMFDHIGGINTMLNALSIGSTLVIPMNRNADDVCQLLQEYSIKVLPSSPTFLNLMLISKAYEKYDLTSLRMITYGTETMPESLLTKLKSIFPRVKFLQTFGTSETGIANTFSKSSSSTFMKIDDPDLKYKVVNQELWLKSKTQILGYLNSPMDSFTEDGWFKTGDLVEETTDGFIKIIGRNKEVINVGGEKVLPNEVESVIIEMDQIDDVMVYGKNNPITGQTVVCDVVSSLNKSILKRTIRKYCIDRLDSYKIPTKVNLVEKTNFTDRFKKIRR
ncbi:fatty acid--CoA ligase family protein [Vibrio sp. HN007]|uniref:ANL family adenylate-forming protein n=1 Tax=Vibrio iocasae TaxID=3098914 RepID=UPI0035D44E49